MDLTNQEILEATFALAALQERKLPVRAAFKIKRNLKTLQPIASEIQEKRQELIEAYAKKDNEGEIVKAKNARGNEVAVFDEDNQTQFEDEATELMETVVEGLSVQTINLDKLEQAGVTVEPALLIDCIFTFDE